MVGEHRDREREHKAGGVSDDGVAGGTRVLLRRQAADQGPLGQAHHPADRGGFGQGLYGA